jgi:hypothetical protein
MKRIIEIKFRGVDRWDRPVFKQVDKNIYFGSVNTLMPNKTKEEIITYFEDNLQELEFFGDSFDCEPHGGNSPKWKFKIIK